MLPTSQQPRTQNSENLKQQPGLQPPELENFESVADTDFILERYNTKQLSHKHQLSVINAHMETDKPGLRGR